MTKLAKKSNHYKNFHVSMIFKGGALLSTGVNRDKRHSEIVAMRKVKNPLKLKGSVMVNFMIKPSGNIGNSRPCQVCEKALIKAGVRKVYHSSLGDFNLVFLDRMWYNPDRVWYNSND